MKNRDYKQFAPDVITHAFNRGVAKMDIFRDKDDYRAFLIRICIALGIEHPLVSPRPNIKITPFPSHTFDLLAYCLMPNHFHLIIHQTGDVRVGKLISKICASYSIYFNKKYNRVGGVFQDIYKAVNVMDHDHLKGLSSYVHLNPVVAGLVGAPELWDFSSMTEYVSKSKHPLCSHDLVLSDFRSPRAYARFLDDRSEQYAFARECHSLMLD